MLQQEKIDKVKKLQKVAERLNISLANLSIAWCIKNPNVTTAILGATKKEQLIENLKSLEDLPLITNAIMDEIDNIMQNKPVLADF